MKKLIPVIFLLASCGGSSTSKNEIKITNCDQLKYRITWNIDIQNPVWKREYLHYVGNCLEDTTIAKKLAELDAEQGNYSILLYGLINAIEVFENIHNKYPISFYNPGLNTSTTGEYYNQEVKKLMKRDLGLDYDSLVIEALSEVSFEDMID